MTLHTLPPSAGVAALLQPIDRKTRKTLEAYIDHLIAVLDTLDGDPDLEPDLAGEPNSGAPCDAEGDGSDFELSGDENEPSLGSLGGTWPWEWAPSKATSQLRWAGGALTDAEGPGNEDDEDSHDREASDLAGVGFGGNLECDGEADREPSLGSLDQPNQDRWGHHADSCTWNITDGEKDDSDLEDVDGGGL